MDYILKLTAVTIISACLSLLIKKSNAELAFLLGTCTAIMLILWSVNLFSVLGDHLKRWQEMLLVPFSYFTPIIKCIGICVVTHLGVNISKDAGQNAVAVGLGLCGDFASALCLIPVFEQLFSVIKNLL